MSRQDDARKLREAAEILQQHQVGMADVSDLISLDICYELRTIAATIEEQPEYKIDWAPPGSTTA